MSVPATQRPRRYRAIIVDDERIARSGLRAMLAAEPLIEVAGEAATCRDAIAMTRALRPDVVFLDIELQGGSGFDVARAFEPHERPAIVIVTAYSSFALEAFGVRALDYLLKPFKRAELADTVRRVVRYLRGDLTAPADSLGASGVIPRGAGRIAVRDRGVLAFVEVTDIDWIEVNGNYLEIATGGRVVTTRRTLGALTASLAASQFLRISRSVVVNLAAVESIKRERGWLFLFRMRDKTEWPSSRRYRRDVVGALHAL